MKQAAELAVADSGVLWTTLRATQFHELMQLTLRAMAKLPVIPVPTGVRFQTVDSGEVADRLADRQTWDDFLARRWSATAERRRPSPRRRVYLLAPAAPY